MLHEVKFEVVVILLSTFYGIKCTGIASLATVMDRFGAVEIALELFKMAY
jgi:hypothetical protein